MAISRIRNPNGSISRIEHPDDASQESILVFAASQFNRGQGEEGIVGDVLKAAEVGFRSSELKGRAGMVETAAKVKDMASPTYYTPVPMMGMPTMSARQLEEEGIEAGKPIEEPERDLFKEDALQFAENLRTEANAMSNTVGLDKDFAQSLPGQVIQGIGQYAPMIMYGLAGGQVGLSAQIAGQMDTEALEEAERTTGKKFAEMSDEEKQQTNLIRLGQQAIGTGLNTYAFSKLIPTSLKGKVSQFLTNKGTLNRQEFTQVVNSLRKDIAVSMASEGVTESAEAFSLDLLTKYSGLDSNREVFSVENIRENLYQGLVGSLSAGGTTTISGGIGKGLERIGKIKLPTPETKAVSEEEVSGKKKFRVKYTRTTKEIGQADVVSEGVREFDAKDEADAKRIVEGSTGKLPGVDLESIIIEEVQPTETKVEPVVQEEVDTETVVDPVDPQETGAEIPIGVFGDVDLETVPDLTPQQKQKILELRQEANAEARKLFGALDDPTGELDAEAVAEGLKALQEISEDGTVGATSAQKQTLDRIREIERRSAEVFGREYIPRTDADIVRDIERTVINRTQQTGATGALFPNLPLVGATTADATTNRTDGRVVEPTGKVTKLVPDGEKLYEIKTTVKTSVRGSDVPEGRPSAEFQPVTRYVTAKSAQEAKQKYKDSNDRAIQEQKRDSRANYPSTVQDEISQRASYKVREIKDYDNDDKTIIRNLFDASGFVFLKDTPFGIDPLIRGEQPVVGATRYMKPTSVRTVQAVRDWKKNPRLADSSQTKKAISELKRPDNKDVISMVRELLGLYDIGNGRVRVYRGAREDSDVKVLSGWSLNPEVASDFQEQARDFGEGEITVATIPIKDVLYKDNTIFDDDAVFQEQELIFDTVENLVIEKQTTDNIKDTFTPKIKEEEAIIKSYRMMPVQQVFDEEGMYDPRLTEEDPYPATEIVEQMDDDVTLEYGDVASETVDGESLGDAPVVGASVNLPNAPQISRKDFKGKKGFFFFSDRTRVGNYTGLFPGEGINIKLQGGPAFAFIQENLDKLAGWAFTTENIFTKFLDKVKKTDGIGFITLYKKENLRANGTFLKAYVAEVKAAIKARRLTTKDFLEAANRAREQVVNLKTTDKETGKLKFTVARDGKGYKLFSKPFKSVASFEKAMELVGFEARGKMLDVKDKTSRRLLEGDKLAAVEKQIGKKRKIGNRLNKEVTKKESNLFYYIQRFPGEYNTGRLAGKGNVSKGLPDVLKMIDLFTDPTLDGRDRGEVVGAVQFDKEQIGSTTAQELGTEEHLSYPLVIKGKGIGAFSDPTNVLNVVQINKRKNEALRSAETSMPVGTVGSTQQETQTKAERSVIGSAIAAAQKLAEKLGVKIEESNTINRPAQYNYETQTIQYNPQLLASRGKDFSNAAMREEIIHAAMHQVIMKRNPSLSAKAAFEKAMSSIGSDLTQEQKDLMAAAYGDLGSDLNYGAEYTRFAVQHILDGKTTEGTLFKGKAMDKVKSLIKSVQSYVAKILGPELSDNRDAAFIIADTIRLLKEVDPNKKPAQQKFVTQAESILSGVEAVDAFADNPYATEEQKKKRQSETARRNIQSVVMVASSFFARIHPQIRNVVSNYFTKTERLQTQAFKQINNFQTRVRGIKNKKDKLKLKQLLYSTPDITTEEGKKLVRQRDALLRKYNIYNDFKLLVQPLLDDLRTKAVTAEMPVGYLYEFFPRKVKDLEGLLNFYGKDIKDDFNSRMAKIDKAREDNGELRMNTDERAAEFRKYMLEEMYKQNVGERIPGFLKKRGKGMLSEEELQFYEDPEVALGGYINTIIVETGKAELLGNGALRRNKTAMLDGRSTYKVNLTNQNGTLSRLVTELNNRGELSDRQLGDLFFGLDQMFGPADKTENQYAELGRTLSYGQLLVDPTTTLSQLYDLAFIALDNNLASIVKTIFTKKDFTLLDAGIDPKLLSAEFQSDNVGAKIDMGKIVKAALGLSGFRSMDALMKETNLTVNYNRYRKVSKLSPNSSKFKKFRSEVEFMVGKEDADRTINDFKNGVYDSPYVRELVVRKLLETQPVNAFEMPMVIQKNPNMRMFYTMKSFILKQGNLINDRMISVIRSKTASGEEKRRAIAALIKLIFTFMMAGVPIDFIKDMIAGRDVYPEDYVDNALLRMFGLSKYNMYEARRHGLAEAFGKAYLLPVPISQVVVMSASLQEGIGKVFTGEFTGTDAGKLIRDLAPMDSVWYYRYGPGFAGPLAGKPMPGVESQRKKRQREAKDSSSIIESLLQFPSGRQRGRRPMIRGNQPIGLDINEVTDIVPFLRNM